MLAVLVIVFREVLEAGLVVGVVLAATRGVAGRTLWIGAGILAGVAGALVMAGLADQIGHLFAGAGRQILNAIILAIAVAMLGWTVVWMSVHGRQMTAELKQVGRDVAEGRKPLKALAIVVCVAVLREGFEVVLFVYGAAASGGITALDVATGVGLGVLGGAAVASALYLGLAAIPLQHVFKVISVLITLLAAGLAAQAIGLLQQAGYLAFWNEEVWNTSHILRQSSIPGRILHTLVGYQQKPTGLEIVAYVATIVAIVIAMRRVERAHAKARPPSKT
jgi:high-affinity iron transporter